MNVIPASLWIPVMKKAYQVLAGEYPVLVIGSQAIYLHTGMTLPSKGIGFLIPGYNPLKLADLVSEALGLGEVRAEFFRRGGNLVTHVIVPTRQGPLSIEVFTRTHLGSVMEGPLEDQVILIERDGIVYRTITLEAYMVLQATRPDGPREVDLERLVRVEEFLDWGRVRDIVERLPREERERASRFIRLLEGRRSWRGGRATGFWLRG